MRRHDLLADLHRLLAPRSYLEIGVSSGASLTLSRTKSIGVDPAFHVTKELLADVHLVCATSDEFFARPHPLAHFDEPLIDLAFIDGLHLAEYALRDFINIERYCHPGSVIVIDDVLPRNVPEANRDPSLPRKTPARAGDVFKMTQSLLDLRPDLVVLEVDTVPTGTLVVMLPDAGSDTMGEEYDDLVESYVVPDPQVVPDEVMKRQRALNPVDLLGAEVWEPIRAARAQAPDAARDSIREALDRSALLA